MATTTYKYIVNDIKMVTKQAFPDADLTGNSIFFWVLTMENFIKYRHLQTVETGAYLNEFTAVPTAILNGRVSIQLPQAIYDLTYDKGVNYIAYNNNQFGKNIRFQQTDAFTIYHLNRNPYTVPSSTNPYFYRVGTTVYLDGITLSMAPTVQMGLYTAVETRPDYINIDTPMSVNEEQVKDVRELVLNLGRFALLTPKDRNEVGTDEKQENLTNFAKNTQNQESNTNAQ